MTDFSSLLLAEQGQQTRTLSSLPDGSANLRAIVLGSKTKSTSWSKGKQSGTITTTSVHFMVVGAKKNIQSMGGRSSVLAETPTGVRFRRGGKTNKAQVRQTYINGLKAFKLKGTLANGEQVELTNIKPDPAFVPAKADDKLDSSIFISFEDEPFLSNPFFCLDDGYTYWADVRGNFTPGKVTEVAIEGVHFDPWVSDPKIAAEKKKKKKQQQEAAAAAASGNANNSALPSAEVEAEMPDHESEWAKYEVRDPATGLAIRHTMRASALTQTLTPVNNLPMELRIPQLFNIDQQVVMNPAIYSSREAHRVYAIPVSSKPRALNEALEFGSFVGPNSYTYYNDKNQKTYGPKDPHTFYFENGENMNNQKSASYPINVMVTNFQKLPQGSTDDALDELPGYTKIITYKDSPYAIQQVNVKGQLYADQCRSSCIANLTSWTCINTWKPIPCIAVMQPDKETPAESLEMSSVAVGWEMIPYLKANAIPVPLKFVQEEILTSRTILQCNLGTEKYKRYEGEKTIIEDRPIENKGNAARGARDLVNLSEFTGDISQYLNANDSWKFRLLIVPNEDDLKEWQQTDFEKYKLFTEYMDKFQSKEVQENPDKNPELLKEFLSKVFGTQYRVVNLLSNKRDFCCNLFAYKDPESLFNPEVLAGRHYKSYDPYVIKAPEENKPAAPAPAPASTPAPMPAPAPAPPVQDVDAMDVDQESPSKPAAPPAPALEVQPPQESTPAPAPAPEPAPKAEEKKVSKKRAHKEIASHHDSDDDEDDEDDEEESHHKSSKKHKKEKSSKKRPAKKARKQEAEDEDDDDSS